MGLVRFLTDMGLFIGQSQAFFLLFGRLRGFSLSETILTRLNARFRRDFIDVTLWPLLCPPTVFFELILEHLR